MANLGHMNPTAPIDGFRLQTGTITPGLALIRGAASDQVALAGAAATALLGVAQEEQNTSTVGDVVATRLWVPGVIAYVQAGAAIAIDALLTTNASGQWVTCTTTQKVLAKAMAAAAAAGDLIPVVFLDGDKAAP